MKPPINIVASKVNYVLMRQLEDRENTIQATSKDIQELITVTNLIIKYWYKIKLSIYKFI